MAETTYPTEWSLSEFPQPNPYFPAPPRSGRKGIPLPLIGKGVLVIGALTVVAGVAAKSFTDNPVVIGPMILGGLLMMVIGFLLFRINAASGAWNNGVIVPAIVARESSGGGMEDVAVRGMVGGLGAAAMGVSAAMTLQYVAGGAVKHATLSAGGATPMYLAGNTVWIALYQGANSLPAIAPPPHSGAVPPTEVAAWLRDAIDAAQGRRPQGAPHQSTAEKAPWE